MLASAALAVTVVVAAPMTDAGAAVARGGSSGGGGSVNHSENGRFNKNNFAVNSPSFVRGSQNIFNQNIGGRNPTQAAFCKKRFHHCKIVQRLGG